MWVSLGFKVNFYRNSTQRELKIKSDVNYDEIGGARRRYRLAST